MVAYHQPTTLDHALQLLEQAPGLRIIAGGTDVIPARVTRAAWGLVAHPDVLDISRVDFKRGVKECRGYWHISPLTTWTDVVRAELPPLFDGLKAAAREVGGVQIQNRGTLVGNICNASPAADGVPPLLALDAVIEITSRNQTRIVPLADFIDGYRHTVLAPNELVAGVRIPNQAGVGHFLKLGARRYLVISIAMASGVFDLKDDGTVLSSKIAVGACSAVAQRLPRLEAALIGQKISGALVDATHVAQLEPINDVRASGEYRMAAAGQLLCDLLDNVAARHGGDHG
jgi:xanthine dehydrogenase small subunit